jgi:autotransporter-associated beta strand protein/T5SS/PEP-CTERM-associated repeat protein
MKPTRSLQFLASSIAALSVAHTASAIDYDANTTLNTAVTSSTGVRVGVINPDVTLTIDSGGSLGITAGSMDFGNSNGVLVVNGSGALNFATGSGKNVNLNAGSGNGITVEGGGTFTVTGSGGTLYMGSASALAPNTFTVTGNGSTFNNGNASGGLSLWLSGSNSGITVSDGGVFTSPARGIYVPGRWGANTNNFLTISGAGSKVTTSSTISVGYPAGGTNYSATNMTMTISNGGEAYSASGYISASSGSNNNSATITGSGSLWDLAGGMMYVGNNAAAENNTLNISNGGALNNVGSVLMNGVNNQFNLGSGSAALLSTATANTVTLASTGALLNLDNGRLIARADGALVSGAGSIVLNGAGHISTTFAGSTIGTAISGSGTLIKEGSGTLTLNGSTATYSGSATVAEGTLALTTLSPASGKTLKGNGTVSGVIDMTNGSTFAYEVNSFTGTGNLLTVVGAVTLENSNGDKVYLTLDDLAATDVAFATGTKFSLMNYSSTLNGQFFYGASTTPLAEGGTFDTALNRWTINYSDSTKGINVVGSPAGSFINLTAGALTAIPEPGSLLALGCLVGSGALLRSRRRTR